MIWLADTAVSIYALVLLAHVVSNVILLGAVLLFSLCSAVLSKMADAQNG